MGSRGQEAEAAARAELEGRRRQLSDELTALTRPPEAGANLSFGKRIGEGTTEAVERLTTTAAARSVSRALAEVERALAKLDEGSYGECDVCGEAIPAERMEALPAAARCVRCAGRAAGR